MSHYGFARILTGPDQGACFHEYLLRGRPDLVSFITRRTVSAKDPVYATKKPSVAVSHHVKLPPELSLLPSCGPLNREQIMTLCRDPVCDPARMFAFPAAVKMVGHWDPTIEKYCVPHGVSSFLASDSTTQGFLLPNSPTPPKWTDIIPKGIGGWDWRSTSPNFMIQNPTD